MNGATLTHPTSGAVRGGLLEPRMLWAALPDALRKLDPRTLWHNPVMFVVYVGSVFTVARSSVAKCPDIGATSSMRGCSGPSSFLKCRSEPNGVV